MGDFLRLKLGLKDCQISTYQKTHTFLVIPISSISPSKAQSYINFPSICSNRSWSSGFGSAPGRAWILFECLLYEFDFFNRRLAAFSDLNTGSDWLPILYNMLGFIQDLIELSVRNITSWKNGSHSKDEIVRSEVLSVIAYSVEHFKQILITGNCAICLKMEMKKPTFAITSSMFPGPQAFQSAISISRPMRTRKSSLADCRYIFIPLVGNYIMSTSSVDYHLVIDAILIAWRMV